MLKHLPKWVTQIYNTHSAFSSTNLHIQECIKFSGSDQVVESVVLVKRPHLNRFCYRPDAPSPFLPSYFLSLCLLVKAERKAKAESNVSWQLGTQCSTGELDNTTHVDKQMLIFREERGTGLPLQWEGTDSSVAGTNRGRKRNCVQHRRSQTGPLFSLPKEGPCQQKGPEWLEMKSLTGLQPQWFLLGLWWTKQSCRPAWDHKELKEWQLLGCFLTHLTKSRPRKKEAEKPDTNVPESHVRQLNR